MDNDSPVDKLIDEQLASDINEILETVEAGVEGFATHTQDLNNPHQVTKEQVGLGNADNTSDMDKPISNAVASAIKTLETGMGLAVQGVMSAIHTHIQENEADHQKITQTTNNMINQVNENVATIVGQINENIGVVVGELNSQILGTQSAVQTLEQTNQQEHQDTLTLLDEKITEVKGLITALDNKIISATATLKTLFAEADTAIKNEVTTAYQAKDTALQTALDSKAANDHNHDSVYAKIGTAGLSNGSVKSNHIAANAVTANHLAPNSVGSSELGYTPAKRTSQMTVTELFTRAGVSGKITTAALVTGIVQNIENFRGITVAGWVRPENISDLPTDNLFVTITVVDQNGIFMEAREPYGNNSLWIGSTNRGTWGGWKQVRVRDGNNDTLAFSYGRTEDGRPTCANSGFRVIDTGTDYLLMFGDGSNVPTTIAITRGKSVVL